MEGRIEEQRDEVTATAEGRSLMDWQAPMVDGWWMGMRSSERGSRTSNWMRRWTVAGWGGMFLKFGVWR